MKSMQIYLKDGYMHGFDWQRAFRAGYLARNS